ncbi:family 43 glycosylhydrolase [Plantactinospora veratri]|uniref:Family 43 glycosylhydrolase n=1 Tax=Plantactinospora veratri TaxID=1436122 RepID=A0ABU7SM58_9ACTN
MLRAVTARHRPGRARGRQGGSGRLARTAVVGLVAALAVPLGGATAQAGAVRPDAPAPAPAPAGRIAADPIAHDPTVLKQGRYYYSVITGDAATRSYLPIKRSADLLHWTELGTVFGTPPAWVVAELGVTPADFWAPDLSYFDGAYHLYYAASSFGTNNSVIGLATSRTLDPASPAYGWVDHGMVMRSSGTDTFNAIDPDVVFDADGQPWLSFGSFWDGLRIRRLDRSTGMPADGTLHHIASRGGASIEGPAIVRRGGYYYLFASLDFCCRGVNADYRTVVGRSRQLTGPYLDRDGVPLLAGGGTDLLRGYNEFRGTGGGDVFAGPGGDWFAHHYYDTTDAGAPKLSVRPVSWADGWPRLGDPRSGSIRVGHGSAWFHLVNRASGAAVGVPDCGYEGADVRIVEPSAGTCQQWRPEYRGDGQVSLLHRSSNKVAEIAGCVNADGARVALWGWLDNDCQRFRLLPTTDGWSRIESRLAGRVLEAAGCGGVGTPVRVWTWLDNPCQQFRLEPAGEVLIADAAGQRVWGVPGCAWRPGPVVADRPRAGGCQLWRFVPAGEGYFRIVNRGADRPLAATIGRDGGVRLGLGPRDGAGPAGRWRIEAVDGEGYRLVNAAGVVAALPGAPDRVLLLTP